MAYSRCLKHPPKNQSYQHYVIPVGGNNTSLICGCSACDSPGKIWLLGDEVEAYGNGVRIFRGPNNAFTKMKAEDGEIFRR